MLRVYEGDQVHVYEEIMFFGGGNFCTSVKGREKVIIRQYLYSLNASTARN